MAFDEAGTVLCIDGRTELTPNPDLGNLPSATVCVIAFDLPERFGYEYTLTSTDVTAFTGAPVIDPSTGANFGTNGDIRADTDVCFQAGDAEAGPGPTHIRLAKYVFSWLIFPPVDVAFCIQPYCPFQFGSELRRSDEL